MDSIVSFVWRIIVYLGLLRNLITLFNMSGLTYANHPSILTADNRIEENSNRPILRADGQNDIFSIDYEFQQKIKTQYEIAIRYYLNRSFVSAWKIVHPLIHQIMASSIKNRSGSNGESLDKLLTIKCFKLYLTLVDLLLKSLDPEGTQTKTDFNNYIHEEAGQIEAEAIHEKFMRGILLKQITQIYNGVIADVDAELFLMCCVIEFSNGFPLQQLRSQMEGYLIAVNILHGTDYDIFRALKDHRKENVLKFYLMQVMVKAENVHESRDLICRIFVTNEDKLKEYMSLFETAVAKSKEDARKNSNSVKKASRKKHKSIQSSQDANKTGLASNSTKQEPENEQHITELNSSVPQNVSRKHFLQQFPAYKSFKDCVIRGWRMLQCQPMSTTLRLSGFVIFILTLLLSITRAKSRQRIRRMILWLITHLRNTLGMAFKVTYV
ncbi:hypothetical protein BRETT_000622 [Brettanomyces bruxellensis]|uniref:Uncharacterized protein n=1 Tax=Dekkera bruxellensis TaxID=5007 RepID=A0A871RAT7_DEKBR|nr:uncharacterized protein BRETT_000622 [Brettanomyces bruxellensis]QOU20908.1 hypothetical protein BRETT_000622 [Brettanomyces bruxellensis]